MGGLPTSTVNGFAVHPTNARVMYVAMRDGVFKSENVGAQWTRATHGPTNVAAIAIDPTQPTEVYAATVEGVLFRSTDGGAQWSEVR